ncbi:MAG: site-specific integrase [Chitinophagaceae bacterium]
MQFPIKPICPASKQKKDGTCPIFFQYCYSTDQRTLLNTGLSIPYQYWNPSKGCIKDNLPPQFGIATTLNAELIRQLRLAQDLAIYAATNHLESKGSFVKANFNPALQEVGPEFHPDLSRAQIGRPAKPTSELYGQLENYIVSKEKRVSKATLTVFKNVRNHLQAFDSFRGKTLDFKELDYNYYEAFVEFLTYDYAQLRKKQAVYGVKVNTIGKTIKQLRVFVKDRVRRKLIHPVDLSDYKIPEEESDAIYLTHDEIEKIYTVQLPELNSLTEYRNLFVLGCLTGLRFSDYSQLKPEDLRRDMLYKKQEKSEHWVVIPLRKEAKLIFTDQFRNRIPKLSNPEFNLHIKTLGKMAGLTQPIKFSYKKGNKVIDVIKPKYEWITSHTARRSFCTNEFLAGTPVKLIMKISGHKNEKDFYKYIRVSPEEAANKIKELWEQRGSMGAFSNGLKKVC